MENSFNIKTLATISAIFSTTSALSGLLEFYGISILLLILAYVLLFISIWKTTENLASLSIIFLIFSFMYAVSGPISVHWGQGLHEIFPKPYLLSETLTLIALSSTGMAIGLIISPKSTSNSGKQSRYYNQYFKENLLYRSAILFAISASLFEFLNIYRAGGIQIIFFGKAFYQSSIAELTGYIPTNFLIMLSAAFSGLLLSINKKQGLKKITTISMCALPWISVMMITGRRGAIAGAILVLILAFYYQNPLKSIKVKLIFIGIALYLAMVGLYVARSQVEQVFVSGDLSSLSERLQSKEVWIEALNPANNEFAAPFGNINTFLLRNNESPEFGLTYIKGFASAIPKFIWPGKPKQELYNFRDRFFPEEAMRGSVASTGYSSILECYVNFRHIGVVLIYAAIISTLLKIEKTKRSSGLLYALFYLMLAPLTMSFHRSSFDASIAFPLILSTIGFITMSLTRKIPMLILRKSSFK